MIRIEEVLVQTGNVTSYDLGTAGIPLGAEVHWRLRAYDAWGPGEWTEEAVFSYAPVPVEIKKIPGEQPGSCQHGGGPAPWLGLLGILLRRRQG